MIQFTLMMQVGLPIYIYIHSAHIHIHTYLHKLTGHSKLPTLKVCNFRIRTQLVSRLSSCMNFRTASNGKLGRAWGQGYIEGMIASCSYIVCTICIPGIYSCMFITGFSCVQFTHGFLNHASLHGFHVSL